MLAHRRCQWKWFCLSCECPAQNTAFPGCDVYGPILPHLLLPYSVRKFTTARSCCVLSFYGKSRALCQGTRHWSQDLDICTFSFPCAVAVSILLHISELGRVTVLRNKHSFPQGLQYLSATVGRTSRKNRVGRIAEGLGCERNWKQQSNAS